MNITVKKMTFFGLISLAPMQQPVLAATYNATYGFNTFSTSNQEKSLWSYRYTNGPAHDGNYPLFTATSRYYGYFGAKPVGLPVWHNPDESLFFLPGIFANKTTHPLTMPSKNPANITYLPGKSLAMQPGFNGIGSVLSFRAPRAGTATIYYSFSHLDWQCPTGYGVTWSIERNAGGTPLAQGSLHSVVSNMIASTGVQLVTVTVAKYDRINFIVNSGAPIGSTPACPTTGATAVITITP